MFYLLTDIGSGESSGLSSRSPVECIRNDGDCFNQLIV